MDADVGGYNIILEESREGEDWSVFARNFEGSVMLKGLKLVDEDQGNMDSKRNKTDENNPNRNIKNPHKPIQQNELF